MRPILPGPNRKTLGVVDVPTGQATRSSCRRTTTSQILAMRVVKRG